MSFAAMFGHSPLHARPLPNRASEVYTARAFDQKRMQLLAARDQARKAGGGKIVAMSFTAVIGDHASSLFDQHGGGGKVPLALGGERDGGVGPAAGDKRKPVGDRVHPFRLHLWPRLFPDPLLEQAAAGDQESAVERRLVAHLDRLIVEKGAAPLDRMEELARRRVEHDAHHRHAVLDQRGRYGPFRYLAQEGARAVDRIDHPHARAFQPLAVVLGLLGEPAIARALGEEVELKRSIDGKVSLAHLGAVHLALHQDRPAEISERKLACVAHCYFQERKVLIERDRREGTFGRLNGGHCSCARLSKLFGTLFKPCSDVSTAYQTLTTSVKRFGKLLWQHGVNQGRLKAADNGEKLTARRHAGLGGDTLRGPLVFVHQANAASAISSRIATSTSAPKSRFERKRFRQFSALSMSSVATCQASCAPAISMTKRKAVLAAAMRPAAAMASQAAP